MRDEETRGIGRKTRIITEQRADENRYPTLFQPERMSGSWGALRNVVEQRYQS
jgi:hypothetical protein